MAPQHPGLPSLLGHAALWGQKWARKVLLLKTPNISRTRHHRTELGVGAKA